MENKKHHIEQEVQKTMDSLDHLLRVEGNPFLYTRLQERLRQQNEAREVIKPTRFPVWQFAIVACLLLINSIALHQFGFFDSENAVANDEITIEDFADEYALTQNEEDLDYLSIHD